MRRDTNKCAKIADALLKVKSIQWLSSRKHSESMLNEVDPSSTMDAKVPMRMIRVQQETLEKLKYVRENGESYDDVISNLFYAFLADEEGFSNSAEYERQRLLRTVRTTPEEDLQELIADADKDIEEYRRRGGRWEDALRYLRHSTTKLHNSTLTPRGKGPCVRASRRGKRSGTAASG